VTSSCSWSIASGTRTDLCGPQLIAACMSARDHGFPVWTGHPFVAKCNKAAAAGCLRANPDGHMWLICGTGVRCRSGGNVPLPLYVQR
jgi:hypothetical protein